MIDRATAEPVVQYLRTLTYNGELSSAEMWDLAQWLNQQPRSTLESWPAKPLVNALQTAFADNELTPAELDELANTIVAIEQLWRESNPESNQHTKNTDELLARTAIVDEAKPVVPAIPVTAEVPDDLRGDSFTVDLQHHTCTCPEWTENRATFPKRDYRRCCAHMTRAFHSLAEQEESLRRDPLFRAFIEDHARRNKGAELDTVWHVVVVNGTRVLYGASPASEWVNVYTPVDGVCKRFGYNRRKKRWAYGDRPKAVAWQIESIFSQTHPQVLASRPAPASR